MSDSALARAIELVNDRTAALAGLSERPPEFGGVLAPRDENKPRLLLSGTNLEPDEVEKLAHSAAANLLRGITALPNGPVGEQLLVPLVAGFARGLLLIGYQAHRLEEGGDQ